MTRKIHATLAAVVFLAAAGSAVAASTIYRTIDEDGNVVFTDVPPRSAAPESTVDVETPNTFTPADDSRERKSVAEWLGNDEQPGDDDAAVTSYRSLSIVTPADDEPLRDNAGNVSVTANIEPALGTGHVMQLYLDGQLARSGATTSFQLSNVDRGTHNLQLKVVDATGNTLISSEASVFHLQRRSVILQPNRRASN